MKKIRNIVAAVLVAGFITGCGQISTGTDATNPSTDSTTTAGQTQGGAATGGQTQAGAATGGGSTTGGAASQPSTQSSTTPVETIPVDLTIILAEGDGIEVTSGDVEVEFNRMLEAFRAQYGADTVNESIAMLQGQKPDILNQLVRNAVFARKADELGIEMENEAALAEYDTVIEENTEAYGSEEAFDKALADAGFTRESYRSEILQAIRSQALADEVTKDIAVSEEEIQESYEAGKDEQFSQKPGATMYHIFFGQPEDEAAEATAWAAREKLNEGAKFSDIAEEYGKDGSARTGGLLGSYPYDTQELGQDFVAEAAKLKEGEISDPVKTSFGWHIIMVENVQEEATTFGLEDSIPMTDGSTRTVREVVESELLIAKKTERMVELEEEWETQYDITVYPDRIPMNVVEDGGDASTQGTDSTQP